MDENARDVAPRAAAVEAAGAGQHLNLVARDKVAAVRGSNNHVRPDKGAAAELGEKVVRLMLEQQANLKRIRIGAGFRAADDLGLHKSCST